MTLFQSSCPYAIRNVNPSQNEQMDDGRTKSPSHQQSDDHSDTNSSNSTITPYEAIQLAKLSCPAFKTSCPFREAADADGIKKALSSLPPSHLSVYSVPADGTSKSVITDNMSTSLRVALQHVHTVSQSLHNNSNDTNGHNNTDMTGTSNANHSRSGYPHHHESNNENHNSLKKFEIVGGCPFKTIFHQPTSSSNISSSSSSPITFVDAMEEFSLAAIMAKIMEQEYSHRASFSSTNTSSTVASTSSSIPPTSAEDSTTAMIMDTTTTATTNTTSTTSSSTKIINLSTALKTGTAISHSAAESVHFVKEFIKGNINQRLYAKLVYNFLHLYSTLERELDIHGPTYFSTLHFPKELNRVNALKRDVEYYQTLFPTTTTTDENNNKPSPATLDYMERIEYISKTEPLLLLSHAYTRYLGDLSGGKILARVARRAFFSSSSSDSNNTKTTHQMNIENENDGLRFYYFENIPSAKLFKDTYRQALDNLHLTQDEIARLVAEANVAFVLNMRMFEELDVLAGVDGASVRPLKDATIYYEECIQAQQEQQTQKKIIRQQQGQHTIISQDGLEEEVAKCPFARLGGSINPHHGMIPSNPKDSVTTPVIHTEPEPVRKEGRCPWPFVFFHDPKTGMTDYQTWIVIGLILCWVWNQVVN